MALTALHPSDPRETGADAADRPRPSPTGLRLALGGRGLLERGDQLLSRIVPKDRPGLLIFVFHCVFADDAEIERDLMDPHERATVERLAGMIDYFRGHGYRFVAAREIDGALAAGSRCAHLSFDDGFANNLRLLDLLEREDAFASLFPSINHVREQRAYWWNVLYRELARRGQLSSLPAETAALRRMTDEEVEAHLVARFGGEALRPLGDFDRPLTVEELRTLSRSPRIEIGNHTLDHAVLTAYPPEEADEQIAGAQRWMQRELGSEPFAIAYPNGDCNEEIVALARRRGLRLGMTVSPGLNPLPGSPEARMRLKRFRVVFDRRARQRMRAVRSPVQLAALARRMALPSSA